MNLINKIIETLRGEIVTCNGFQDYLLQSWDLRIWKIYNTEFSIYDIDRIVIEKDNIEIFLEKEK